MRIKLLVVFKAVIIQMYIKKKGELESSPRFDTLGQLLLRCHRRVVDDEGRL
jgi:hypothetical protein